MLNEACQKKHTLLARREWVGEECEREEWEGGKEISGEEGAQAVHCSWIHQITDASQEHLTEVALDKYRPIGLPKPRELIRASEILF